MRGIRLTSADELDNPATFPVWERARELGVPVVASRTRAVAELFPDEVQNAAVMFGNTPSAIDTKDKVLEAFPNIGWNFLDCPQEYNIAGETDWRPFVHQLEDCGVEAIYFVGSAYPNFQNLLDAAAQEDYNPLWLTDPNSYLASFAEWNASGNGDNVYVATAFTPFEQAEDNPATQQYIDIVEANGGTVWVESARGAGATSVAVASGHYSVDELRSAGADHVLASLKEELPL